MSLNPCVLTKRKMDKAALVGIHRLKGYGPMLTNSSRCSTLRHLGDLIATTTLVALDIDHDGESEAKLAAQQQREHSLERFKRTPVTADEDGKIGSGDIKDDLTLITVVLINRRISSIEEAQKLTEYGKSHIYERIDLLVS